MILKRLMVILQIMGLMVMISVLLRLLMLLT